MDCTQEGAFSTSLAGGIAALQILLRVPLSDSIR
jgi:hypothetical protein